ncbi:MAG: response regulator [Nitrococcus sp.]|nr:response regulator [Nitrococcus sp.]
MSKQPSDLVQPLRRLNEDLEQHAADRTADLEDLTERLRRLAAELTQTEQRERKRLADVIHNHLQQLLVGAKIWVHAAHAKSQEAQGRQPLAQALSLLDQAIAESRSLSVQLRPPALYESGLIAALRWLTGWMKETHGLKVTLDLDHQAEPDLEHGAVLLFEAVRELLLNTVKHAEVDEAEVGLSRADGDRLCLSVADQGKGFDAATVARQRSGGFGLFSIREQLYVMGGTLEMESSPGSGTSARLFLPIEDKEIDLADAPEQVLSPGQSAPECATVSRPTEGQIKVLLVDNHSLIRDGIACLLQEDGAIAVIAEVADGEAAIEALQSLKPDVAIIDINVPGISGVKTTRAIMEKQPGIKVVCLSIHEDDAARQGMLDAGACAYLLKDGPAEVLIETVKRCIEKDLAAPTPNIS